ncbi:hypothetical protein JR316_0005434 [Psilocybe cubensis]|uniref:Uncharacterized protein n=2 Tax=Psilocybe cubensis TaxID=181762 RepID=A0ACB8H6A7_PSICU|nr:hypothetical protein JR316_0005434 [Psilocybe cubensis]KAH9483328.1 hypothetical protein JR316_0005434 [Psilocybe cubensis]
MPPSDAPNQTPLYRINVELDLNPFLPVSYVTKIIRYGVNPPESLVAEFAIALNNKRAVLRMGDTSTRLSNVLYSVHKSPKHFNWILAHQLHWDCREVLRDGSPLCIDPSLPADSSSNQSIKIAQFIPPPPDRSPPHPDATLTVYPTGHQIMDEIIVSALVVERMLTR